MRVLDKSLTKENLEAIFKQVVEEINTRQKDYKVHAVGIVRRQLMSFLEYHMVHSNVACVKVEVKMEGQSLVKADIAYTIYNHGIQDYKHVFIHRLKPPRQVLLDLSRSFLDLATLDACKRTR